MTAIGGGLAGCGDDSSPAHVVVDSGADGRGSGEAGASDAGTQQWDAQASSTDASLSADASSLTGDGGTATPKMRVELQFRAKFGSADFKCEDIYENAGSGQVRAAPQDMRMFVQDVSLIRAGDGVEVPIALEVRDPWQSADVALLDFIAGGTGKCEGTPEVNHVVTGFVEPGEYVGLAFSNGVPAKVNHKNPINLPRPLTNSGMQWTWTTGFIFFKAELRHVPEAGTGKESLSHMGSNMCDTIAGRTSCAQANRNRIVFPSFDRATQAVIVDVAEVFTDTDLAAGPSAIRRPRIPAPVSSPSWAWTTPQGGRSRAKPCSGWSEARVGSYSYSNRAAACCCDAWHCVSSLRKRRTRCVKRT